jgi:hypothetical protein
MAKLKGGTRNLPASHTPVPLANPASLPVHSQNGVLIRHLQGIEDSPWYFNRDTERLYAFNQDGSLAFTESQHEAAGVGLDISQLGQLKDKVILHNHPSGHAFSLADIETTREYNAFEMRATGKYGTFILRRPKGGWPSYTTMRMELANHLNGLPSTAGQVTINGWSNFAKAINADFAFVRRQMY